MINALSPLLFIPLTFARAAISAPGEPAPIGVDLEFIEPREPSFAEQYFTEEERALSLNGDAPDTLLTALWCCKEAVSKAFGTGIGEKLDWHDLEIVHHDRGRPMVRLHGKAKVLLMELGGKDVHISLSHSDGQAAAMAVLEG